MNDLIDLKNHVLRGLSIAPQSVNGTVNGSAVNCVTGGAEVIVLLDIGTVGSGATGTVTIESSLNDNTEDGYANADAYTQINGSDEATSEYAITGSDANTQVVMRCILRGEKYVRVKAVTTDAILLSASVETAKHIMGTVQTASA